MRRFTPLLFAACLLVILPGCKSNNADGRLVGTWVCNSVPKTTGPITMTWVFGADNSWSVLVQGPGVSKTITGKYRLGFSDAVYMDHLSEQISGKDMVMDNITVSGNQMTGATPTARRPSSPASSDEVRDRRAAGPESMDRGAA